VDEVKIQIFIVIMLMLIQIVAIVAGFSWLLDAYADNPVSRHWHKTAYIDCPVQPGATIVVNEKN
jgi:hypothetical protein